MSSKYAATLKLFEHLYTYPEKYYMKPFRIYGNLWFVGNGNVGAYLLEINKMINSWILYEKS